MRRIFGIAAVVMVGVIVAVIALLVWSEKNATSRCESGRDQSHWCLNYLAEVARLDRRIAAQKDELRKLRQELRQ
jgi:hypothetical protein